MISFLDGVMIVLFVLFMVFIFGGYHKTKSSQREEQFRLDELKKSKDKEES